MDRLALRIVLAILATLAVIGLSHCPVTAGASVPIDAHEAQPPQVWPTITVIPDAAPQDPTPLMVMPDTCARVVVRPTDAGPRWGKVRPSWLTSAKDRASRQRQLQVLISIVVEEMGGDAELAAMIHAMALRESSGWSGNIHVRAEDMEANRSASRLRRGSAWEDAGVLVYLDRGSGLERAGVAPAWPFGRGLFGQVTGLHARWVPEAPPWWLCDPVLATVSVVWSMRAGLDECGGSTLRDAHRRFASGRCARRSERRERSLDRIARGKFDPDAPARLGSRWDRGSMGAADRAALWEILSRRAQEHGVVLR